MKRLPSVKTLDSAFPGKGQRLRRLLESGGLVRAHPAAIARVKECYHAPGLADLRMAALNAEAGTYGVEHAAHQSDAGRSFDYLNTGDTYAATIVRFSSGRYAVASWGDIVERGRYV